MLEHAVLEDLSVWTHHVPPHKSLCIVEVALKMPIAEPGNLELDKVGSMHEIAVLEWLEVC